MTDDLLQGRDRVAATYLLHLQQLASEISVATDAISANQMQAFRESVERQELLCGSLSSMSSAVSAALAPAPAAGVRVDASLAQRIRAACTELQDLNFKYAALIKHSGRSIALLSLLCKSQSGQFLSFGETKRQTWSCEV